MTLCSVQRAGVDAAPEVAALLRATAQWLIDRGAPLWPVTQFTDALIVAKAAQRELVTARRDGALAGCMFVEQSDPLYWPDRMDDAALYLHKIAVARAFAGQGVSEALAAWAADEARAMGRTALRLDCDPRPPLLRLYAELGFEDAGPFRAADGFLVQRFEMRLVR